MFLILCIRPLCLHWCPQRHQVLARHKWASRDVRWANLFCVTAHWLLHSVVSCPGSCTRRKIHPGSFVTRSLDSAKIPMCACWIRHPAICCPIAFVDELSFQTAVPERPRQAVVLFDSQSVGGPSLHSAIPACPLQGVVPFDSQSVRGMSLQAVIPKCAQQAVIPFDSQPVGGMSLQAAVPICAQ